MSAALFNERQHAFETKFAHENETEFLVRSKGGALFVQWIAGLLGMTEEVAREQANRMITALMDGHSDKSILTVVSEELNERGQDISARQLATRLIECRAEARRVLFAH